MTVASSLRRIAALGLLTAIHVASPAVAEAKPFMEYLAPTPVSCAPLSSASWGVAGVLPRDLCNGIESAKGAGVPPDYYYWDGQIIRAKDGKYHLFMSTWAGSAGFNPGWTGSDAYHAVSDMSPLGPYARSGYVYTNNGSHKGHNVSALELPDGTYAVVVSETVPFTIYTASSLDGPWTGCQASIQSNGINYGSDANFASNVSLVARHDGKYEIVQRHGLIGVADTLCGPYKLQKPTWAYPAANRPSIDSIYPKRTSIPGVTSPTFAWEEDPHIWRSAGTYHVLYSGSGDRVGYHLYSADGIHDWTDNGLAFTPRQYQDLFCYAESTTCSQWYKMERPGVLLEDGHPTHVTWAVADVDKDNQIPAGSNHGSKVIVVPIDGVAFDADFGSGSAGTGGSAGMGGAAASGGAPATGGNPGRGGAGAGGTDAGSGGLATGGGTSGAPASGGSSGGRETGGAGSGGSTSSGGSSSGAAGGGGTSSSSAGSSSGAPGGSVSAGAGGRAPASGASSTGGNAGAATNPANVSAQDSPGCGCVVGGTSSDTTLGHGLLLCAVGLLVVRKRRRARTALSVLSLGFVTLRPSPCRADNPIVQTSYTADPAPVVYGDRLYLYTSHDEDVTVNNFYTMNDWRVYSTVDMVNWTDHGSPAGYKTFSWGTGDAWAPQGITRDGKFFLFVPLNNATGAKIGVGVANNPAGPFMDPLGKALAASGSGNIDPTVFIDDDDQAYMYWGNGTLRYVKLNADMTSYSGSVTNVSLSGFVEGPWFYKRGSLYYMVYAATSGNEKISYATSNGPTGPWTTRGDVMAAGSTFTNHPGVVDYKGHSYFFYHNGTLPGGSDFKRSVCVEEFTYGADGSIPKLTMSTKGAPGIATLNPFEQVEAETIAFSAGLKTEVCSDTGGGMNVRAISNGDYIKVKDVDFKSGVTSFDARVSSAGNSAKIELHLDSQTGTLLGSCDVSGVSAWTTKTCAVSGGSGKHDLFLTFSGGSGDLFKFNWWKFTGSDTGSGGAGGAGAGGNAGLGGGAGMGGASGMGGTAAGAGSAAGGAPQGMGGQGGVTNDGGAMSAGGAGRAGGVGGAPSSGGSPGMGGSNSTANGGSGGAGRSGAGAGGSPAGAGGTTLPVAGSASGADAETAGPGADGSCACRVGVRAGDARSANAPWLLVACLLVLRRRRATGGKGARRAHPS